MLVESEIVIYVVFITSVDSEKVISDKSRGIDSIEHTHKSEMLSSKLVRTTSSMLP